MKKYIQILTIATLVAVATIYTACYNETDNSTVEKIDNPSDERVLAAEKYHKEINVADKGYIFTFEIGSNVDGIVDIFDEENFSVSVFSNHPKNLNKDNASDDDGGIAAKTTDMLQDYLKLNRLRVKLTKLSGPTIEIPAYEVSFSEKMYERIPKNDLIFIADLGPVIVSSIGKEAQIRAWNNPGYVHHYNHLDCSNNCYNDANMVTYKDNKMYHQHKPGIYCNRCDDVFNKVSLSKTPCRYYAGGPCSATCLK